MHEQIMKVWREIWFRSKEGKILAKRNLRGEGRLATGVVAVAKKFTHICKWWVGS